MGNKYIEYKEIVDYQGTGETKWFLEDNNGNRTPIFNNKPSFIDISESSCMFLGENNGFTKLYLVDGKKSLESNELYQSFSLEGDAKNIVIFNDDYIIVDSNKGQYFYNLKDQKRTSDFFDYISSIKKDKEEVPFFEKSIVKGDARTTLYGVLSCEGKLGGLVYDTEKDAFITTPSKVCENGFDVLDYEKIYNSLDYETINKYKRIEQNIKRLTRINGKNR